MTYASHRHVIKAADYVVLDPNAAGVYALLGPSWDDDGHGKVSSRPDDLVPIWLARNGFQLGPQIGPAIINKPEKERWTLHRVYSSQPRSGQPSPADSKPLRPGTDD
jgi:hypothetical protein